MEEKDFSKIWKAIAIISIVACSLTAAVYLNTITAKNDQITVQQIIIINSYIQSIFHPGVPLYTPTSEEVYDWLVNIDNTDKETYNDTFTCGDFSIMLINHMREKGWRGLFVAMEYDFYGEIGAGIPRYYGHWGHAFVAIQCTDGLWFIEPQTDGMWYWMNSTHTHLDCFDVVWHWTNYTQCASAKHSGVGIYTSGTPGEIFIQHINRMG